MSTIGEGDDFRTLSERLKIRDSGDKYTICELEIQIRNPRLIVGFKFGFPNEVQHGVGSSLSSPDRRTAEGSVAAQTRPVQKTDEDSARSDDS
jgi:hypothetical protein